MEEDPLPPQGKDQTRPAEKYCWASGRYALEKRLLCFNKVVHSLLGLPCLSAALEILRQGAVNSENLAPYVEITLGKFSDQRYKPMYTYILRNQSGFGDTIDR